ncbi:hypothetical protein TNCV_2497201 [Trichonephila clavipes]|nr:hypothetical protein TNCV_2497201 [Trichonephila clavipes]
MCLERAEAVTHFRLTTRHALLEVYHHWLGTAAVEACPPCGHARMDCEYLLQCTGPDEYSTDVSQYWETRRQMVKKPSTGIG